MNSLSKSSQLINWVDNAINSTNSSSDRGKFVIAIQTLISFAGVLRAEHHLIPYEEHTYKLYLHAQRILAQLDPNLSTQFHQIIEQKDNHPGRFNLYGVDAIQMNNIFTKFTKTKAKILRSKLKSLNKEKSSYNCNYRVIESWCNTLGFSIELVRLEDTDLNDLHSYLTAYANGT